MKKRYDRPDGSRLTVAVSTQYVVAASEIKAECLVRRRNRAWIPWGDGLRQRRNHVVGL